MERLSEARLLQFPTPIIWWWVASPVDIIIEHILTIPLRKHLWKGQSFSGGYPANEHNLSRGEDKGGRWGVCVCVCVCVRECVFTCVSTLGRSLGHSVTRSAALYLLTGSNR